MRERSAGHLKAWAGGMTGACVLLVAGCATAPVAESRSGAGGSTPPPCLVEPDAAPSVPLSIEGAVLRALDRSGDVAALRAAVALAEQRRRAAGDLVDPELQFGLSGGSGDGDRLRESTRRTETSSAGNQGSRGTSATTETTAGLGGIPDSTASGFRETAEQAALTSAGTRTESSRASGWTSEEDDGYRIGVRLFVPNLWQWSPRMAARRAEIEAARADLRAAEWNVASKVRRLCGELDFQTNDLALAEARLGLDEEIVKLVKARADRGAGTAADVMAATRRHLQMRNDLYQARQRLRLTQRSLADLLDMPVSSVVLAPEGGAAPSFGEAATQAERMEERALQNRADVAALRWRSAAAQFAYREARRARYPWVKEISASYRSSRGSARGSESSSGAGHGTDTSGREQSGRGQSWRTETGADGTVLQTTENRLEHQATSGTSESWSTEQGETWTENRSDGDEWQVGLAVDVPIFTWFRNHADDVLLAERNLAVVREAEAERTAVREVRNAIEELEDCRREQARYASEVEPLVDEMKRTLAAMENAPGVMPEQLAMARLQCLESERIKIESAHRCREALIALERAAGAPLAEILPSVAPESKAPAAGK